MARVWPHSGRPARLLAQSGTQAHRPRFDVVVLGGSTRSRVNEHHGGAPYITCGVQGFAGDKLVSRASG